tara:strand:+ start:869 stop:2209 length:1341 start_codon:yes stop_codon:yes gene_type:complete
MQFTVKQGMNQDILKSYPDNYFDSIVTDPPYGIEFLGKDWDSNTGAVETWQECYRVLKPGGHLLAFSAARTYHHLATNIEIVGFEIRDQLMWIYASGFPKAQDIGKALDKRGIDNEWSGWKTALKPGHEPIVMARKPFKGATVDNMLAHGTGALNIDVSRVEWGKDDNPEAYVKWMKKYPNSTGSKAVFNNAHADAKGVDYIKDKDADINKDRDVDNRLQGRYPSNVMGEITDYQKYFYCPKVSREERHCGFESVSDRVCGPGGDDFIAKNGNYLVRKNKDPLAHIATGNNIGDGVYAPGTPGYTQTGTLGRMKDNYSKGNAVGKIQTGLTDKNGNVQTFTSDPATHNLGNNHPTVKPVALMKYLIQLVTPPGGKVLDPFTGSGSTGMAAVEADMCFTGCELDPNYVAIANKRIEAWYTRIQPNNIFDQLFDDINNTRKDPLCIKK